jgi:hypothetical protein
MGSFCSPGTKVSGEVFFAIERSGSRLNRARTALKKADLQGLETKSVTVGSRTRAGR